MIEGCGSISHEIGLKTFYILKVVVLDVQGHDLPSLVSNALSIPDI